MNKKFICTVIAVITLICCTSCSSSSADNDAKLLNEIVLGSEESDVTGLFGDPNDKRTEEDERSLIYKDYGFYGQSCEYAYFNYGKDSGKLESIKIIYPENANCNKILKSLKEIYGESEKQSYKSGIDIDTWYYNDAIITFTTYSSDYKLILVEITSISEQSETDDVSVTSKAINNAGGNYLSYASWSLTTPYAFAIEVDSYDGDILAAGSYTFSVTNTKLGEAPLYDIYIRDKEYSSISELGEPDFGVGGANSFPITRELKKGSYVYVIPYNELVYEPKGYLEIELN